MLNATAKAVVLIKTEPVLSDENHSIHSVSTVISSVSSTSVLCKIPSSNRCPGIGD